MLETARRRILRYHSQLFTRSCKYNLLQYANEQWKTKKGLLATENTETWHTLYIVNEILAPKLFSTQKQKQGTIVAKASDGQRYPMP